MPKVSINLRLTSEEIDRILSDVYGEYLVSGRPTKHGGLRFLDIHSARTFGFEPTREEGANNVLSISAPFSGTREDVEPRLKKGPHGDVMRSVEVRPSSDPGKQSKMFLEASYLIPSTELLSDASIMKYAKEHKMSNSSAIARRILREHVAPLARAVMDQLIDIIRQAAAGGKG